MNERAREHLEISDDELIDTVVADTFTVDFCSHGYGQIAFWHAGEQRPFAVAHFDPQAVFELAVAFAQMVKVEGHA